MGRLKPPVCFEFSPFDTQTLWPFLAFAGRASAVHAVRISSATTAAQRSMGGGWFVLAVVAAFAVAAAAARAAWEAR